MVLRIAVCAVVGLLLTMALDIVLLGLFLEYQWRVSTAGIH
jgi:hypothetical protein